MFFATDALVLVLRAITFVALFQAAGAALFLAFYHRDIAAESETRIRNAARVAALVALCAAVGEYVLTPARMAGDFGSTFDPSLESLLLRSNSGSAHIVRVVGLAVLLLSLDQATQLYRWAATGGAGLSLLSFVLMGHTVIHAQRWLLAPLLLLHVVVGAAWLGALLGLYVVARDAPQPRCGALVARFSAQAIRLVPLIFVCGAVMSVLFIAGWSELATGYGAMVIGKVLGFGLLMALAARNKWRFGPQLLADVPGAAEGLRRTIAVEWVVIALILVATAVMTSLFAPEHIEGVFAPGHDLDH